MSRAAVRQFDVAVIGGGPAGAAAALALARSAPSAPSAPSKHRVLLVDATAGRQGFKAGESLPPAVRPLLRDLGALPAFLAAGHLESFGNESAWGSDTTTVHDFIRDPEGHGWHLDRVRFDGMLRRLARAAGAEVRTATRLHGLAREAGGGWRLSLTAAERRARGDVGDVSDFSDGGDVGDVGARWLVDATGRAAHVAHRLGARTAHDDRQVAFTALYAPRPGAAAPADDDRMTLVESADDGWWYTALLPRRRRVVAFLTGAGGAAARAAGQPAGFGALLARTRHVRARLAAGGYRRIGGPQGGPASGSRLTPGHGEGWLAAGDAALAFDPLSSQGIFTALYGGLRAAQAIAAEIAGERGRVAELAGELDQIQAAYRRNRRLHYAAERRWTEREFWRSAQR